MTHTPTPLAPTGGAVFRLAIAETVSWGVLFYSFGVMMPAMESEWGVGRPLLTFIFSAALLVSGLMAAPIGRSLDRSGARPIMTVGSILAALFVWAWSRSSSTFWLYVVWLGIGAVQALTLYEPAFFAATDWFSDERERARALVVVTLLTGLSSTIFVPLSAILVERGGWRFAVQILACILAAVTIPLHASLPVRRRPRVAAKGSDASPEPRPPGFGWMTVAFVLQGVIYGTFVVHAVPMLVECGHAPTLAAFYAGLFGVSQVAGRLLLTIWWERVPARLRVAGLMAGQTVGSVFLALGHAEWAAIAFVGLLGLSNGLLVLVRPLTVAEWHGTEHFGAASGRLAARASVAKALAPALAGALHHLFGSYSAVVVTMAASGVAAVAASSIATTFAPGPIPDPSTRS